MLSNLSGVFGCASQRDTFSENDSVGSANSGSKLCLKKYGNLGPSHGVTSAWKVDTIAMKMAAPKGSPTNSVALISFITSATPE